MMIEGLDGVLGDSEGDKNYAQLKTNPIYEPLMDWLCHVDRGFDILARTSQSELLSTLKLVPYHYAAGILEVEEVWKGDIAKSVSELLYEKTEFEVSLEKLYFDAIKAGNTALADQVMDKKLNNVENFWETARLHEVAFSLGDVKGMTTAYLEQINQIKTADARQLINEYSQHGYQHILENNMDAFIAMIVLKSRRAGLLLELSTIATEKRDSKITINKDYIIQKMRNSISKNI